MITKTTSALIKTAAIITALSVVSGAAVWAGDTRWVTISSQQQSELRQLKRDIKRLELKDKAGNATPEDRAFVEFLKREAEELSQ